MKRKSYSATIALYAVFAALTALFLLWPFVFLLPLIVAVNLLDFKASVFASVALGLVSVVYAYSVGAGSPVGSAFQHYPWIAVVPRLFVGPAAYGVKTLVAKAGANSKSFFVREVLPVSLSGATATIVNSTLVLGCFAIFLRGFTYEGTLLVLMIPQMLISSVVEIVVAVAAAPLIAVSLKKAAKGIMGIGKG